MAPKNWNVWGKEMRSGYILNGNMLEEEEVTENEPDTFQVG